MKCHLMRVNKESKGIMNLEKISQLQKIKQLKRNMVCKYKFVLMNNEYNLYFNSFTKEYPLILYSLNLTRTRDLLAFGSKMD